MENNNSRKCFYCGCTEDLRPYGPGGVDICYDCMKSDPELEKCAQKMFKLSLESMKDPVIGFDVGPIPLSVLLDPNKGMC